MLAALARIMIWILVAFAAIRLIDLIIRGRLHLMFTFDLYGVMFWIEMAMVVWAALLLTRVNPAADLGQLVRVAMLIILLLLVGQFNSFRRPAIILLTIPLGLIGVIFGLLVARSYFGFMTLLGIVSLAGIVINNAIVLLDRIKIEIEVNGLDPARAVVEAAQRRLRPILLTTATTVGGLLPLWFGGGPMWEPMAIAMIFGLMFATALTLGIVPVLYSLFFRISFRDVDYQDGASR